jgi:EAL domain-containing protein (putative c-di-GMP-specific phosphodiesterase class I)
VEAIREKRIVPYFQPIMNVQDGTVLAYEVLTRIVTAGSGKVIPAAEFIEAAEGMGAIGKIDYLLIEQAFDKMKQSGYTGKLFLNLSPKALVLNEFMPTVRSMLKTYDLQPSQMVFEITERDTVKNLHVIEKFVRELLDEGFRFAIDDFGAGYSSFLYIKAFRVDYVKVDGEFIRNMVGDAVTEKAIVRNIAALSASLGIKSIAEYVETEEIMEEVRSAGIDYAQGYYIQRPSPDLS